MPKKQPPSEDIRHLKDTIGKKWVSVISISAFLALGVWMLIDPESPEHSSVEKGTVYIMKEIWSWPAGLIIVVIFGPMLYFPLRKISMLSGKVWIKLSNGYYLFNKQKRLSGLPSMQNGDDMIVFNAPENSVLCLKGYNSSQLGQYQKAIVTHDFNCQDAYWNANESGFSAFYKGVYVANPGWERRGSDLIVTSPEHKKQFVLANYDNLRDNKIRKAKVLERNTVLG